MKVKMKIKMRGNVKGTNGEIDNVPAATRNELFNYGRHLENYWMHSLQKKNLFIII